MPCQKLTEEEREQRLGGKSLARSGIWSSQRTFTERGETSLPSQQNAERKKEHNEATKTLETVHQSSGQDNTSGAADVTASEHAAPATLDQERQKHGQEQTKSQPIELHHDLRERKSASPGAESQDTHDAVGTGADYGALPRTTAGTTGPNPCSRSGHSTHIDIVAFP